ncbi:hypothetical protein GCM10028806_46280 [Spirosoma terrae]|uniref:Uncharacterized protein n=1 Tax=Spirosoma terrae TaxID=1968276 RepID=A0A6L9KZN2_9BACT|nr:hypothetical protein [Spirosoma terrae]NDU93706.1 hypothetical protein [Spirosoma terrae]
MTKGLIRLSYRKIIDASSQKLWDKYVFDDTHMEFYMQAQLYNKDDKYNTFQELIDNVPQAEKLHYLTSRAAVGYIRQLNGVIPDVLNSSGKVCLPFTQFTFEILRSHVSNKDMHKIALTFYSEPITWIDTLGDALLIAYGDKRESLSNGDEVETDTLYLQPFLSISSLQATRPS